GHLVDPNASHVQIALGAIDALDPIYCNLGWWPCHSQAPLIDNVLFYRQANFGPKWTVRAIDLFQDTFPRDGSLTGTGRADMAQDPAHGYHEPEYFPGDSAVVYSVTDYNGLALVGGPPYDHRAVYCYVSVAPPDPNKAGVNLENSNLLGGLPRFAYRGMVNAAGMDWTQLNCDRRRNSAGVALSDARFCIDLPDNLFEAGDTIHYFFGAHNTLNEWSYWTREAGAAYAIEEAAALPLEFQILPGAGAARGGDILYVDGMDGLGAQPYFDTAFQQLADYGKYVDRFDVNGPSSGVSNRLGTRVYDIAQLTTPYRAIVWNTGDLPITIGDGTGNPEKSNDWLVLDAFLQGLWDAEQTGGLYLNGDDLPSVWAGQVGASAVAMRDWLHYSLPAGGDNHLPLVGVSPYGVGLRVADNAFGDPVGRHALGVDTLVAFGGCPAINDFDFVTPTGAATVQMEYRGVGDLGPGTANAIIGERHPSLGGTVSVLMSGFSFHYIRDDRLTAELDRAHHLRDVLRWFATGPLGPPTGAGDGPRYTNSLAQNYPNPFNPTTTITFTVKARTRVRLRIYDVTGALVKKLVDDVRAPGITHEVRWDGRNEVGKSVASGVYFYRLVAKDFVQTRKMVVLK
ncbi:MAG: T9SS type A sorting domain-containing protein, partial [Candidatus Krumholzibacteria bacterium]|nr:T9SS type A sorting domain-containing protein [Candidatus Krumholzibacteria bacterium]